MTNSKGEEVSYRSLQAAGQAELDAVTPRRAGGIDWDARWHAAGEWCSTELPDLIDPTTNAPCGFAVATALRLRGQLRDRPTPGQVRAGRAAWMRRLRDEGTPRP